MATFLQVRAAYTDAVSMIKDGHAQVMTLGTTAPASAVMDLASARDVQLVPADDKTIGELKKQNAGYNKLIIKALTLTNNSDVFQPSIWNTTPLSGTLAPVDEAFLKTLYGADIPYEATVQSAMPALLRRIAAQLI